jgi:hypothetical protein
VASSSGTTEDTDRIRETVERLTIGTFNSSQGSSHRSLMNDPITPSISPAATRRRSTDSCDVWIGATRHCPAEASHTPRYTSAA